MSRTVVIHQPDFLPYLGFFHRLLQTDLLVVFDNVQFLRRGWNHRDKIKTAQGETWITLPVVKCPRETAIKDVTLFPSEDWKTDHLRLIEHNYKNAPFYREISPRLQELYKLKAEYLMQFSLGSIELLLELFGIKVEMIMASSLQPEGQSNELLVDILKKTNATCYLSGVGARDYFKPEPFDQAGIQVQWQEFTHPVYPQQFGEFIPYLSSIDLLLNCGIEESRKILRSL